MICFLLKSPGGDAPGHCSIKVWMKSSWAGSIVRSLLSGIFIVITSINPSSSSKMPCCRMWCPEGVSGCLHVALQLSCHRYLSSNGSKTCAGSDHRHVTMFQGYKKYTQTWYKSCGALDHIGSNNKIKKRLMGCHYSFSGICQSVVWHMPVSVIVCHSFYSGMPLVQCLQWKQQAWFVNVGSMFVHMIGGFT